MVCARVGLQVRSRLVLWLLYLLGVESVCIVSGKVVQILERLLLFTATVVSCRLSERGGQGMAS